jgi:hypothetical protein
MFQKTYEIISNQANGFFLNNQSSFLNLKNQKMETTKNGFSVNLQNAIDELSTAKSVAEWNAIRKSILLKDILNQWELNYIDSSGLIVKVLGSEKA